MKRICTLATVLFRGTPYTWQIEGIKEAENVPTAFSQMHGLALLVDFLFLNMYIESGALAPYSAVGRIVRRILRRKKWNGSGNHKSVYIL
jgi:hypothetical protein